MKKNIMKKVAGLAMIGALTISQSIGAFAMDKDVVYCSFGGPHELGSGLNYK